MTSDWHALGSGLNNTVHALALDGAGNLYVGGGFTIAGGKPSSLVAHCRLVPRPAQPNFEGDKAAE